MIRVAIRAEDKNCWERRTPLTPDDGRELLNECELYVQKSEIRCFSEEAYELAGFKICESYQDADIVIGVKEIPKEKLLPEKVYLFFSHCIKGQKNGIELVKKIIKDKSTLIDYERIVDENNKRLISFGKFAGYAGALDTLWLLGEQLKIRGYETAIDKCKRAIYYQDLKHAKTELKIIGKEIKEQNKEKNNSAIIIGILGYGSVSKGAEEILSCLPINIIEPAQIKEVYEHKRDYEGNIFLSVLRTEHLVKHKENKPFKKSDYYQNPTDYTSNFEQYIRYLSVIINGLYWNTGSPSIVTWDMLQRLYQTENKPQLSVIADISCDKQGAVECNMKYTNIGFPHYYIDPLNKTISDSQNGAVIAMLAVDNFPAELSRDASIYFSSFLKKYLKDIVTINYEKPLESNGMPEEIRKAVIVYNGKLTPDYKYLEMYF